MDQETEKIELEDQFILRLPPEDASHVRSLLPKPKKLRKKLKLDIDLVSGEGFVFLPEKVLKGRLRKLPTIIESLKTYNKIHLMKTADICYIFDCVDSKSSPDYIHGLTPPLKNVKKKRFRKYLINRDEASLSVQKELFYLLQADLEAVHTKFELINMGGDGNVEKCFEKSQIELFGNILTDSETDSNIEEVEPMIEDIKQPIYKTEYMHL